eukprot:TRINITY_DN40631_c0_g1_i1.p1 TRINITY_DN40631_c0_g1~~TRINITY_DN40631_c0_g1_i1.p1  ORF type:complete len:513 (-),score=91.08 TRINITY_DN40631_c0_g1_i1:259-1797(-)
MQYFHRQNGSGTSAGAVQSRGGATNGLATRNLATIPKTDWEKWKQEDIDFVKKNDMDSADVWYLVDVRWLRAWKDFVKKPGIPSPGPVDNSRLVDDNGRPRPGLRVVEDYRGVNDAVWHYWLHRYDGGPEVRRSTLDLYADRVEDLERTAVVPRRDRQAASRPSAVPAVTAAAPPPSQSPAPSLAAQPPSVARGMDRERERRSVANAAAGPLNSALATQPSVSAGSRVPDRRSVGGSGGAAGEAGDSPSRSPKLKGASAAASGANQSAAGAQPPPVVSAPSAEATGSRQPRASTPRGNTSLARMSALTAGARRGKSVPSAARAQATKSKPLCCDKCDGPHESDRCPHFKAPREQHKDAWSMLGKAAGARGSVDDAPVIKNARVVRQPGDGSCLFHSLSYGLSDHSTGQSLRREICDFIMKNPNIEIGDNSLKDWVQYDGGGDVQAYARQMSGSSWGGGIEMAALTKMKNVNVHVYEACKGGYRRISAFESPGARKVINVLYQGRAHYDALDL